jgi:SulP family sulfate permease
MTSRRYSLNQFRGDLFGGLTAGIVALPLALAFGVASGAGAVAGLYGAIALGFFAALFGGTHTQISGPTGPMTVILAATLAAFPGNPEAVFAVVMTAGAMQIILGLIRVGGFVRYMPYPVISGFMSGIGVIIILMQLHPLLGAPSVGSTLAALTALPRAVAQINGQSLSLAALAMGIVFFTPPRITRVLPSPLIALLATTVLAQALAFEVPTIGEIPGGLPRIFFPWVSLDILPRVVSLAMALAVLGTIDSLLTSVVADSMTKAHHDSNRELVGQGLGNMAAALVGGLPGAGATMRTVVNIKAGGTTRLSGIIHALFLLAVLLGLGEYAARIPMPVLAGILMKVGIDILDYRMLKVARRVPRQDLVVMLTVFAITVLLDLIVAVAVGVTLASLMLTFRIARQSEIDVLEVPRGDWQKELERELQEQTDYRIRTVSVHGPFFFGTTARMQDKVNRLIGTRVVIINCLDVPFMDLSALFALGEMIQRLKQQEIKTILVVRQGIGLRRQLMDLGYGDLLGADGIQVDYTVAVHLAWEWVEHHFTTAGKAFA